MNFGNLPFWRLPKFKGRPLFQKFCPRGLKSKNILSATVDLLNSATVFGYVWWPCSPRLPHPQVKATDLVSGLARSWVKSPFRAHARIQKFASISPFRAPKTQALASDSPLRTPKALNLGNQMKHCCWFCSSCLPPLIATATKAAIEKADSTLRSSRAVPHPSTNRALCRLTSEVE